MSSTAVSTRPLSEDGTFITHVDGFTVMAVIVELSEIRQTNVGLAFCSPYDRLNGRWDRERGREGAMERARSVYQSLEWIPEAFIDDEFSPGHPKKTITDVKDYVVKATMLGHSYVPHSIAALVKTAARKSLGA